MPANAKSLRSEWSQCVICKRVVCTKDTTKHVTWCTSRNSPNPTDHGFIADNVLLGVISPLPTSLELKSSLKNEVVAVHPSAMRLLGLCIGQPAVIQGCYVKVLWPCTSLHPTSVGMTFNLQSQLDVEAGAQISVEKLNGPVKEASEVYVSYSGGLHSTYPEEVLEYFQTKLDGQIISESTPVKVPFYGQQIELTVNEVKAEYSQQRIFSVETRSGGDNFSLGGDNSGIPQDLSDSFDNLLLEVPESPKTPESKVPDRVTSPESAARTPDRENFCSPVISRTTRSLHTKTFYKLTSRTVYKLYGNGDSSKEGAPSDPIKKVNFSCVGGLAKQIETIKEMIELPIRSPELFKSYGVPLPKGILLYGPSGAGKTLLAHAVANEIQAHVTIVNGPELWSKFYGETEAKLRALFRSACERSPSLIVIDEVDAICGKREASYNEVEKRVVTTLLTLLDGIDNRRNQSFTLVVAVTSRPEALDPALRRPGRFDREVEIGVPTYSQRVDILTKLLEPLCHTLSDDDIRSVCENAHGFVGADLAAVCKEGALHAIKQQQGDGQSGLQVQVSVNDLRYALTVVQPSAMREVQMDVPKVKWDDIGGQQEVKLKLKQAIEWPLKHPEAFTRMGISPPRGVLLYGPPGCSKTMIAKALATESGLNFIAVKGPELFSKWVGESERAVREVFRKARNAAPSIIFFDEIDALAIERGSAAGGSNVGERVLAQLLTEMDGVEVIKDVTVVAATNRPDMIDKALLRPGRLDRILYVPLPDSNTRADIFAIHFRKMPVGEDVRTDELVARTDKYSGAEVSAVCHEAAMFALQEDIHSTIIHPRHFDKALDTVKPRTSDEMVLFYESYHQKAGISAV